MAGIAVLDGMQREIMTLPRVRGIITIQNSTALPVRTNIPKIVAATITHHIMKILPKAHSALMEVDPHDILQFCRIRGKNFEYIVYVEKDFTMVAVQEHTAFVVTGEGGVSGALKMVTVTDEDAANANAIMANYNKGVKRGNLYDVDADFFHVNFSPRHY